MYSIDQRTREDAVKQLETAARDHWVTKALHDRKTNVATIHGAVEC